MPHEMEKKEIIEVRSRMAEKTTDGIIQSQPDPARALSFFLIQSQPVVKIFKRAAERAEALSAIVCN